MVVIGVLPISSEASVIHFAVDNCFFKAEQRIVTPERIEKVRAAAPRRGVNENRAEIPIEFGHNHPPFMSK